MSYAVLLIIKVNSQDELSKETLHVSYLNVNNNESKENDESWREDDEIQVDKSDAECSNLDEEMIIQTRDRGKNRPALLKTGKPGRSRNVYQIEEAPRQDPKSTREIMERDNVEL